MILNELLKQFTNQLEAANIITARLDALVLLEDATGKDRAWLLAHPDYDVKGSTLHKLEKQLEKRLKHIPLAQVRGKTEFYGLEFIINEHVLEPRPESETMIDFLKHMLKKQAIAENCYKIVDVGTGSGALAITAKLEFQDAHVAAIDIDQECLLIARKNATKHKVDIKFYEGNLLEPLHIPTTTSQILLCNLPYVPDDFTVNNAALNEPKIAIFGGPDGLDLYRRLFLQIATKSQFYRVDYVFTESLPFQHNELKKIAKSAGYKQIKEDDFIQLFEKY